MTQFSMACLIRIAQSILLSSSPSPSPSKSLFHGLPRYHHGPVVQSRDATSALLFQSRPYAAGTVTKSPLEANILRILRNEIEYQSEYAPPHQSATEFKSFTVEDHPGGQWITTRGRFGDNEQIKIEVTMFDGFVSVPKAGEDSTAEDVRLHISVLVDISKGEGCYEMEFLCSAWPDRMEIQKVYMLRRDKMLARPYMGSNFRNLKSDLQKILHKFLEARGVNDELSVFLHEYMMNKDRIELIQWLRNVKSFVEK